MGPATSPTPRTGDYLKARPQSHWLRNPKTDLPQGSQPTLAAYEYDANGEPRLEDLIDERVAKLNSEKQVKFLTNQLQEVRGSLHVANQDLQSKLDTAERRAERYLQRRRSTRPPLTRVYRARRNQRKLKAYASTARPSLRGKPHDSISDESDGPVSVRRHRSATKLSPDAPLPATTQRRSKQPEPAVFEGPTGTKASTYQKWKLDMQSWFRAHPYPFANNEEGN
ncbi:hypothetical protein A1F94_011440 [Pyrenophora tritici-repentis]|nr:hypothetical protein A1F94_011440 [Pyrenophora tritici-repentis]